MDETIRSMTRNVANRNWTDDITFILKPLKGTKHKDVVTQMVDYGICSGTNRLRAIREANTNLWTLIMDKGRVPSQLKQLYTGFSSVNKAVTEYMHKRNIEVIGVKD